MIRFSKSKINIGLRIINKRSDGYHSIETAFYPVSFLSDVVEIIETNSLQDEYMLTGIPLLEPIETNLCYKAVQLLRKDFEFPKIQLHLHKIVPMGAGLGGGSADASSTLCLLNELFLLNIPKNKLLEYASQLGSDCPFFIDSVPQIGEGRGEILSPINIDLSGKYLLIVKPNIHISTAEAYKNAKFNLSSTDLKQLLNSDIKYWKSTIVNDFENSIFNLHPAISQLKASLYKAGALYAQMSGSGAACYGIFDKKPTYVGFPDSWSSFGGVL